MNQSRRSQADRLIAPWTLRPMASVSLNDDEQARVLEEAARCRRVESFPLPASRFGADVAPGYLDGPMLVLEDHRPIDLTPADRLPLFEYRSYGLARGGDYILLSRPRVSAFEHYYQQVLGLEMPTVLHVSRGDTRAPDALALGCRRDEKTLQVLAKAAAGSGGLNVLPYIASGHSWMLASDIARLAKVPVRVCGPSPKLARKANDKLWFSAKVRALLGQTAIPPTEAVFGLAAAAAMMRRLARQHARVVIKLPSSAGSMGNLDFDADFVGQTPVQDLRKILQDQLQATGWSGRYPVLVGVWETKALASPSVQMWLPKIEQAGPIIEAIVGQTLSHDRYVFIGATSIDLPERIEALLVRQATMIGTLMQQLGYLGRLSLDALLVGETLKNAALHWVECNGRWGGVSIPMTLAGRLGIAGGASNLTIVQRRLTDWSLPDFKTSLDRCSSLLFRPGQEEGVVFTEPTGPAERGASFFTTAPSAARREELAMHTIDQLLISATVREPVLGEDQPA